MAKSKSLNPETFESLLAVLSLDRDEAGRIYEQLREGLIRFFYHRGCDDGETLADETINRVAAKIDQYDSARAPRFSSYCYGFASKVLLEYRRQQKRSVQLDEESRIATESATTTDSSSERVECLRKCITETNPEAARLVIDYYSDEGGKRKDIRKALADSSKLSPGALHTKVFRIRAGLRSCVEKCLLNRKI